MKTYLGLDLGTSVLKATLIDDLGRVIGANAKEVHLSSPKVGYAEESPTVWWNTFKLLLKSLSYQIDFSTIAGIGLSGQMHGLVCCDDKQNPLCPAIIWADKRSLNEVEFVQKLLSVEKIYGITGNPISTGFILPSLLWLKNNEQDLYNHISYVLSPKDFIALKLTGNIFAEPSDALATGCFDYRKNDWSDEIIETVGLKRSVFPKVIPTSTSYGGTTLDVFKEFGIPEGTKVFGGSDQSMAAMGAGLIDKGSSLLAISTGGQFLVVGDKGFVDSKMRLHTLNHAVSGVSIYMAATLAAGLSLKWFKTSIMQQLDSSYDTFIEGIDSIAIGSDGLFYLPFLTGERTPYFNSALRGAFIGQSIEHNRLHFVRAIMEGVAFSFRDGLNSLRDAGLLVDNIILSGGGTKNATWRKIITDVLNVPTQMINIDDHSPFGAAVYAKFAQEGFDGLSDFYTKNIVASRKLKPSKKNVDLYSELFDKYKSHADYLNGFY